MVPGNPIPVYNRTILTNPRTRKDIVVAECTHWLWCDYNNRGAHVAIRDSDSTDPDVEPHGVWAGTSGGAGATAQRTE